MLHIVNEINSILRNNYIKTGFILLFLIFVVSFDSSFNKYFAKKLGNDIVFRLIFILITILLLANKHYEISIMLILIFIVSLYNSRIANLLKLKIDTAVNELDEKLELFVSKKQYTNNIENKEQSQEQPEINDDEENIDKKCLSQNEIIYSEIPYGQLINSNDMGLDSYELDNTQEHREFEYLE